MPQKVLHIFPHEHPWRDIVSHWIGKDRSAHTLARYPLPTNEHYLPERLEDVELMKVCVSWDGTWPWKELKAFFNLLKSADQFEKVIVWHAEDANSRLLFYTVSSLLPCDVFEMEITPPEKRTQWEKRNEDEYEKDLEPVVFQVWDVNPRSVTRESYHEKKVSRAERKSYLTEWKRWAGEDALDSPILVNQFGELFHPHRTHLYSSILKWTPKDEPGSGECIIQRVREDHPQMNDYHILKTIEKMANEGLIKWVKKDTSCIPESLFQKYKYDVEGEWNYWDRDFVYHFMEVCGKTITMSDDDLKAEITRDHQDYEDLYGKGHLTREEKRSRRRAWNERMLVKWAKAYNENWGWPYLLEVMKTKMEMIVEYMRDWTPIADGPVYADQMERAIGLIKIVLDWGGEHQYAHAEDENDYLDAKHFTPYVNMRNRHRFHGPDNDGNLFFCEAQRLRFDKAWDLLWEMFRTKLLDWED